jgi:hypothetical protein
MTSVLLSYSIEQPKAIDEFEQRFAGGLNLKYHAEESS